MERKVVNPTDDGRPIKMLTLIDEFTRECLAIYPAHRIRANDVIDIFADVMIERGVPQYIRSDNGIEDIVRGTCTRRTTSAYKDTSELSDTEMREVVD